MGKMGGGGIEGDVNDYSPSLLFVSFAVSREGGSETGREIERQKDKGIIPHLLKWDS